MGVVVFLLPLLMRQKEGQIIQSIFNHSSSVLFIDGNVISLHSVRGRGSALAEIARPRNQNIGGNQN